ncbi:MAG: hypothetical protein V4638_07970 [Bacteroidota bacterium]
MKEMERGFILVRHTNKYWEWANRVGDSDIEFTEEDNLEPNVYLIEEDFLEIEPLIEKHFKSIFALELEMVTENESDWPEKITMELFNEWFILDWGSSVIDLI